MKMQRTNRYTLDHDEWILIDCPKCKGKQGIRRSESLVVHCVTCQKKIGVLDF